MESPAPDSHHGRFLTVLLAGIIGVAFVGFAFGTRPAPEPARVYSPLPEIAGAIPGQTYAELRERRYGPNHAVTSDVSWLGRALFDGGLAPSTPADRARAVAARTERRAYDGAPPTIPHVIDEQSAGSCLSCHERGIVLEGRIASPLSHPAYPSCTQCHVPSVETTLRSMPRSPRAEDDRAAPNAFVGLRSPGSGTRAWKGAPPTIPHRTFMRERCESCHGYAGRFGLRTPHPDKVSCTQCHVSDSAREPSGAPPFASVPGGRVFGAGLRDSDPTP